MDGNGFTVAGIRPQEPPPPPPARPWYRGRPVLSAVLLAAVVLGCLCAGVIAPRDPAYMDLLNCFRAPDGTYLFGTDAMGRDIFSMVWHGGRVSLAVGLLATAISTAAAILYGAAAGLAPARVDGAMMRLTEIFLSVPSLLMVLLLQAVLGRPTVLSISLVIGLTGWMSVAKVVRMEVRRLRQCEYVLAARCMGGGFMHILVRHLTPNLIPSIMFMVVMNVRSAIVAESTLSFLGVGLPLEVISWGSMLSMADSALTSGAWWIILIPGLFLAGTLLCITQLGDALRRSANKGYSNL